MILHIMSKYVTILIKLCFFMNHFLNVSAVFCYYAYKGRALVLNVLTIVNLYSHLGFFNNS
jgi:hypothetical protein